MQKFEKVKNDCLERWSYKKGGDDRLEFFDSEVVNWLKAIPSNYTEIIISLLNNFNYYSRQQVNKNLKTLFNKLKDDYSILPNDSIYTNIFKEGTFLSSSNEYLQEFKNINDCESSCVPSIKGLSPAELSRINNIIYIDDCIGSGATIINEIKNNKNILRNKNIFYAVIHGMEESIEKIKKYGNENGFNIICVCIEIRKKAFADKIFPDNISAKKELLNLSMLYKIFKASSLGYKNSQSLMAFYNNTPNNTLGIFWQKTEMNSPIFLRKDTKLEDWRDGKKDKKNRTNKNYEKRRTEN